MARQSFGKAGIACPLNRNALHESKHPRCGFIIGNHPAPLHPSVTNSLLQTISLPVTGKSMSAGVCGRIFASGTKIFLLFLVVAIQVVAIQARAAAPSPVTLSSFDGQWQLVEDDSDDILKLWHEAVREQMKRSARRTSSNSPMAMPANPGQHINLPMFLATFKRVVFRSTPQAVVIEQQQFQPPDSHSRDHKKIDVPNTLSREVNLHPEATSISLRESARKPPTMFIGGWEKGELVIETTTDEGLRIEEHWHIKQKDKEEILYRKVRLRSSIWGEKTFEQQFGKPISS